MCTYIGTFACPMRVCWLCVSVRALRGRIPNKRARSSRLLGAALANPFRGRFSRFARRQAHPGARRNAASHFVFGRMHIGVARGRGEIGRERPFFEFLALAMARVKPTAHSPNVPTGAHAAQEPGANVLCWLPCMRVHRATNGNPPFLVFLHTLCKIVIKCA